MQDSIIQTIVTELTRNAFIRKFNAKSINEKIELLKKVGVSIEAINEFKIDSDSNAAAIVENFGSDVICDIWVLLDEENAAIESLKTLVNNGHTMRLSAN